MVTKIRHPKILGKSSINPPKIGLPNRALGAGTNFELSGSEVTRDRIEVG